MGVPAVLGETARSGAKLPVYQNLRGAQPEFDYTVVLKIETHM